MDILANLFCYFCYGYIPFMAIGFILGWKHDTKALNKKIRMQNMCVCCDRHGTPTTIIKYCPCCGREI